MGGHQSGDLASRYLVRNLCTYIRETDGEPPEVLLRAVQQVNGELYQLSTEKPEYAGMGTTLVAATVKEGVLYVANVGDSRLYLVRRDGLKQVTRDHSFVEEMVSMGRMERGSQSYLEKKNIITRAVGIDRRVEVDLFEVELEEGDYILLCSDGLSNMVDNTDLFRLAFFREVWRRRRRPWSRWPMSGADGTIFPSCLWRSNRRRWPDAEKRYVFAEQI